MASLVEILIKAKDEASKVIEGVTGKFEDLGEGAKDLKTTGGDAFGEFQDKVAIAMLAINQTIEVGMKIAEAAKIVYDGTVGKALAIADEVEKLSRISGEAPENMSALRVAAEEAKVPFDDLYKAMENLNKNGIPPTVDNLVAIADEYVNLQDPLEKAKLLTDNFGAAGDEIAPMLEAIAGGVKEVQNAGLIFTEADIQAANDYEAAVSRLKSAWDGIASTVGVVIVSGLADILSQDSGAVTILQRQVGDLASSLLNATTITKDEYISIMQTAYTQNRTTGDSVEVLTDLLDMYGGMAADATTATDNATWSVDAYGNAALEAGSAVDVFGSNTKRVSEEDLEAMRIAAQETQKQIEDLQKALEVANLELDVAIRTFSESIGGDLAQGLKDAGLEGDELLNKLGLIDQAFGTSYVLEYKLELATDDLLDTLINDPDNFLPDAQQFLDYFTPLQGSVIEAMGKVDELEAQLSELERTWNIRVKITTEGGFPGGTTFTPPNFNPKDPPQFTQAAGGMVQAAASGLAASLPYYWVGERGPEPFFPSVDGRIVSNTQAMSALRGGAGADSGESIVVNINTPMNFADKAWVERTLAPYIQKGIREAAIRG